MLERICEYRFLSQGCVGSGIGELTFCVAHMAPFENAIPPAQRLGAMSISFIVFFSADHVKCPHNNACNCFIALVLIHSCTPYILSWTDNPALIARRSAHTPPQERPSANGRTVGVTVSHEIRAHSSQYGSFFGKFPIC